MNTIFDIEQKRDSAEKLAAVANKPHETILFADEFNDVTRKALEGAINDEVVMFSWSNNEGHRQNDVRGFERVQLLEMKFKSDWLIQNTDEVWLLIDRYKPKKIVRTTTIPYTYKRSGFHHELFVPGDDGAKGGTRPPKRPSEIRITSKEMILDFGQTHYFKIIDDGGGNFLEYRTKGFSRKNTSENGKRAWVYLQFRLKVKKGDKIYYSKPKAIIEMVCRRQYIDSIGNYINSISYKLV